MLACCACALRPGAPSGNKKFDAHADEHQPARNGRPAPEEHAQTPPASPPKTERVKATPPITAADSKILTVIKAIGTPTASASMLVASASTVSRLVLRGASVCALAACPRASKIIRTPIKDSTPKARRWFRELKKTPSPLPKTQPIRGMANWNAPNQHPIFTA